MTVRVLLLIGAIACPCGGRDEVFDREFDPDRLLPGLAGGEDSPGLVAGWCRETYQVEDANGTPQRIVLGDLLELHQRDAVRAQEWRRRLPAGNLRDWLDEVLSDAVHADDWSPRGRNHENDSFYYFGSHRQAGYTIHKMSVLIWSDPATINARDRKFSTYTSHVGSKYRHVRETKSARKRASDGRRGYKVDYQVNLPVPFADLRYVCAFVDHERADGTIISDYFDTGEQFKKYKRFNVFAGRDSLFPIRNGSGAIVATAVVTAFAMDVAWVPDGEGDCVESMQQGLGNMKRENDAR